MPYSRQSPRSLTERQRERAHSRDTSENFANTFDQQMRTLHLELCSNCNKRTRHSEIVRNNCSTCRRSDINLFSAENGKAVGEVPGELRQLTMIEQILIARVHPVVSVFKIRGQQRAYSGHVMNFVQHVENIATRLRHNPRNIDSVIILNRETPNGLIEFRVRSGRVRADLIWLK